MVAATLNLTGNDVIEAGSDYSITITLTDSDDNPEDLTDWDIWRSEFRVSKDKTSTLILTAVVVRVAPYTSGTITLSISASTSTAVTGSFSGRYDIEAEKTSDGTVRRFIQGSWTIDKEVTD